MFSGQIAVVPLVAFIIVACGEAETGVSSATQSRVVQEDSLTPISENAPQRPSLDKGQVAHLSPIRVLGDTSSFGRVTELAATNSVLVAADAVLPPMLKVVDLESGAVSAIGRRGEGPEEFQSPRSLYPLRSDPPTFQVFDYRNQRLSEFRWSRPRGEARFLDHHRFVAGIPIKKIIPVASGEEYVANGLFPDYTLLITDSIGQELRRITTGVPVHTERSSMREANLRFLASGPQGKRFAVAWQYANRIDLLPSLHGNHYREVKGPRKLNTQYTTEAGDFELGDEGELGYTDIYATSSNVYALFCGCSDSEETSHGKSHLSQIVHVFGWNGTYKGEIEFGREVMQIAVSENDSLLWAATWGSPIPRVVEYVLPSWLRNTQ